MSTPAVSSSRPRIHVAFQWHMHQPIYWPYESVVQTSRASRFGFDPVQVHLARSGPYTAWPLDAVRQGLEAGLGHLGAQVSFSGSLMENLDALERSGIGFRDWQAGWQEAAGWRTTLGNPRVDLVRFGYHHSLMPLTQERSIELQLALHSHALATHFGPAMAHSKGMFPPETGFAPTMIPALVRSGVEWVLVDNIHFDRTRPDYPYTPSSNLIPANAADQRSALGRVTWLSLRDLWAPSKVAVPWGYQPHYVAHVDPDTGEQVRVVAVPAARYEGNEDGRGGFGALQYERVFSQYERFNIDPQHPMLVVLHHDGDNYGGGTDSYYHQNFAEMIRWLRANPERFEVTTIQDYLDRFPPAPDDVIHVENGSWSGADNGDPEFKKWNGDPTATTGYSPDRVSWAVVTAAHNRVATAEAIEPITSIAALAAGGSNDSERAWRLLLNAETSCYWYWDHSEGGRWDAHPTRASNAAVAFADAVLTRAAPLQDRTPPSVFSPQRKPYNPGGVEWGQQRQPTDFAVWTLAYDVSGLARIELKYRVDRDGRVDDANLVRAGAAWQSIPMVERPLPNQTSVPPRYIAAEFGAVVSGVRSALVDYYVEASDSAGNVARSPIQHVFVGPGASPAQE
jgi:hypothetical protein